MGTHFVEMCFHRTCLYVCMCVHMQLYKEAPSGSMTMRAAEVNVTRVGIFNDDD